MKRLLVVAALLFVPLLATAQMDAVLTPDGTLYSVAFERAEEHPDVKTESAAYLKLTSRRGDDVKYEIIPSTLEEHYGNYNPIVAYDNDSGMLFVFWLRGEGLLSKLMFTSRTADGAWAPATVFGDGLFDQRRNLRLAVTRKFRDEEDDVRSGLSVHLAWWELNTTSGKGTVKYVMASIHNGNIVDFVPVDLNQFIPAGTEKVTGEGINKNFLKQPVLFTTPLQDSVVLLFGDIETNTMNQVRITPRKVVGDGRLRVPGGRREGSIAAPKMPGSNANSRVEGVYADSSRIALYEIDGAKMNYVVLNGDTWSEPFALTLDDQLSAATAVDALRRLVNEH